MGKIKKLAFGLVDLSKVSFVSNAIEMGNKHCYIVIIEGVPVESPRYELVSEMFKGKDELEAAVKEYNERGN